MFELHHSGRSQKLSKYNLNPAETLHTRCNNCQCPARGGSDQADAPPLAPDHLGLADLPPVTGDLHLVLQLLPLQLLRLQAAVDSQLTDVLCDGQP